ncbi:MAG: ABC transporter substrate-binding protein [Pseudomonadota bacterium]
MILFRFFALWAAVLWLAGPAQAEWRHAMAMHGNPANAAGFKHYPYVNPAAPKGGKLRISTHRNFDSTNPLIVKGVGVPGARLWTLESLMARGHDEAFTLYGLLAEAVDLPDDRSWVAFRLRKEARFADGMPVTVDDVIFSLETLRDEGRPNFGTFYSKVSRIERLGEREFKLHFSSDADREIPLIMGLMPILPKHAFETRAFAKTSLKPFPGSGPYEMASVDAKASICATF